MLVHQKHLINQKLGSIKMVSSNIIKKFVRKDSFLETLIGMFPELIGGLSIYGVVGSGKTVTILSLSQKYHDLPYLRYKIFDLWGGERKEHYYWSLPSKNYNYWNLMRAKGFSGDGPKQYKVRYLFPMTKNLPKSLPFNPPHVFSKIFTIPFRDIITSDFMFVKGTTTQTEEYLWRTILSKAQASNNGADLDEICKKLNMKSKIMYLNVIKPFIEHMTFQSSKCEHNLDVRKEMSDRETISVLCLEYVPEELKLFVVQYILRKVKELLDSGKMKPKNIFIIREASEFFRITDSSVTQERKKAFKDMLSNYVRMGRRGTHLFMDTQSPQETKGLVGGSEDFTIFGRLVPTSQDATWLQEIVSSGMITKEEKKELIDYEPGMMFVIQRGKKSKKMIMMLCRTEYWMKSVDFFSQVWKARVDRWQNFKDVFKSLSSSHKSSLNLILRNREDERTDEFHRTRSIEEKQIRDEQERYERQRIIRERIKKELEEKRDIEPSSPTEENTEVVPEPEQTEKDEIMENLI